VPKGFTKWRAANPKSGSLLYLGKHGARWQRTLDDLVEQGLVGLIAGSHGTSFSKYFTAIVCRVSK
jgi:hypothetical protein